MASSQAKALSGELVEIKSAVLDKALRRVAALTRAQQDLYDAKVGRYQLLVEAKYTRGLSPAETAELADLEKGFQKADERFYAPLLDRVSRAVAQRKATPVRKRRALK